MILKLYTIFVALLLALFIGVGIAAFYPGPKSPDYPSELQTSTVPEGKEDPAVQKSRLAYDKLQHDYQIAQNTYNRNVSILSLIAAVALLLLGLTVFKRIPLLADGLALGAVFTLSYSIIRGFASDDTKFRFLVVTVGLGVALWLGYVKFIQPATAPKSKR